VSKFSVKKVQIFCLSYFKIQRIGVGVGAGDGDASSLWSPSVEK
jgi:hypothetical protein